MDRDGTNDGYDLALTRAVADAVPVPVIASGGVGELSHLAEGILEGGADAVLAASIFHYGQLHDRRGEAGDGGGAGIESGSALDGDVGERRPPRLRGSSQPDRRLASAVQPPALSLPGAAPALLLALLARLLAGPARGPLPPCALGREGRCPSGPSWSCSRSCRRRSAAKATPRRRRSGRASGRRRRPVRTRRRRS